jgi:HK97 family phage portal protein
MNRIISQFLGWFGYGGALGNKKGTQVAGASGSLVDGTVALAPDGALQLSTVWACVSLLANMIASLPFFVYTRSDGQRELARETSLWTLLHDSPNSRMTSMEFWVALLLNLMLRNNAYARIDRTESGEPFALWPMAADQIEVKVMDDGSMLYCYRIGSNLAVLPAENVLHLKGMGNGTMGLDRLDYMRATTAESANAQRAANQLFINGGKPSGVLMIDRVIKDEQRQALKKSFKEMTEGTTSRLFVLEADMKYSSINFSPEDQQLLETRKFTVEELCRWFGVPPVLVGHSNVTTWGTGVAEIIDGFYKLIVRPALVNLEQAVTKRVLTSAQRARYTVEFSFDALLRASLKDRMEIYARAVQNGLKTRNECRQLENDPPIDGANELTAQTNLAPLHMLGKQTGKASHADTSDPTLQ